MDLLRKIHLPWKINDGALYSKIAWINGKKRICVCTALQITIWTWTGLYPDVSSLWLRIFKKFLGYFAFISSLHLTFSTGYGLYLSNGDIEEIGDYFYLFLMGITCISGQLYIRYFNKDFGVLFEYIEDNFGAWPVRDPQNFAPPISLNDLRKLKLKVHTSGDRHPAESFLTYSILKMNRNLLFFMIFAEFVGTVYLFKPFLEKYIPGYRHLPHKGYFLVNEQESPWYEMIYAYLVYGAWVNATFIAGVEYLLMEFHHFLSIHIQSLQLHLEYIHIFKTNFTVEIIKCIKHHRNIIKFANYLENLLNILIFVFYFTHLLEISFVLLRVSSVDDLFDVEIFSMINVFILTLMTLFYICYNSQYVMDEALKINDSLYATHWYNENKRNRILVKIFYYGLQKSIYFTAGKFMILSLATWIGIIKAAYSFYTLINQAMEDI